MLQRRLSQPFDCKARLDGLEAPEITEFGSWLDERFRLREHGHDPIQIDPLPPPPRFSGLWPALNGGNAGSRRGSRLQRPAVDSRLTLKGRLIKSFQCHVTAVRTFWDTQVSVNVPIKAARDHSALERTFFAYLRTSATLSMMGATMAQLLVLQHAPHPELGLDYSIVGKPLACACQVAAIVIMVQGAWRFWIQQHAILRGKIRVGGWALLLIGFGLLMGIMVTFVLFVAIDIRKESQ
ncbi:MAG: hypothetical protein M1832_005408 [Thelocarpon impressellum]|nr:MAG: hypothetical protein M1832_005408 [Thelocarpon impressellum]